VLPQLVEMIEDQLEGPGAEDVGEVVRLIRDQIAERDADTGNRRLVECDQRVPERDEQQQLGEPKQLVAERVTTEHHLDTVPNDEDRRESHEERVAEPQELWLVGREQGPD